MVQRHTWRFPNSDRFRKPLRTYIDHQGEVPPTKIVPSLLCKRGRGNCKVTIRKKRNRRCPDTGEGRQGPLLFTRTHIRQTHFAKILKHVTLIRYFKLNFVLRKQYRQQSAYFLRAIEMNLSSIPASLPAESFSLPFSSLLFPLHKLLFLFFFVHSIFPPPLSPPWTGESIGSCDIPTPSR